MKKKLSDINIYRIIHIQNLEHDIINGLHSKINSETALNNVRRVEIGNKEIISERDHRTVPCYPGSCVNNYVPFYFSIRTPMLYNIVTGHGVPKINQADIIYLCCNLEQVLKSGIPWCFTNGNAAKKITKFYNDINQLSNLDWRSINATDFRNDNSDNDPDRVRKKHSEFLVRDHLHSDLICAIIVYNQVAHDSVLDTIKRCNLEIPVYINPKNRFYF